MSDLLAAALGSDDPDAALEALERAHAAQRSCARGAPSFTKVP
ncbi:MAG: hypothetical protein QM820_37165 [Minicystis sp.]